ncbi:MAG: hypothetical protein GY867_12085 [bacterium]|nr:hypothetical protein [bacterium]
MKEKDLTGNLRALLTFVEGHIAREIPDRGTFDPYGILLRRKKENMEMVFLETMPNPDGALKGEPVRQMRRQIEDMLQKYRNDRNIVSACLATDMRLRPLEGGEATDAVFIWLDDRGKQRVRVVIDYEIIDRELKITAKTIDEREELFLSD